MLDTRFNYVVAAAKTGSFSGAAEMVGVTQSAVTKSIADLEAQIGFMIFQRTSRGTLLTKDGRDFVERATRLQHDARELLSGVGREGDPYAETLRIGVCPASLQWRLARPLAHLAVRHGEMRFNVSAASLERVVHQLREGSVDVAVGFAGGFADWPEIRCEPLGSQEVTLFVRKGHPLTQGAALQRSDLARFDFVSPSHSRPFCSAIAELYEEAGLDWRKWVHMVDDFTIAKRLVAASDAIGIATRSYSVTAEFRAKFVALPEVVVGEPYVWCCATRPQWEPKPSVRAFIAEMRRTFTARAREGARPLDVAC